jgi:threonine/homoserine/homoserine lactone efflux protein
MPSIDSASFALFLATTAVILLTPGPAVLYIVARSLEQGRLAGIVSVLGIACGTLFHIAAAAVGLSALLVSSAAAFSVIKLLGAAYLVVLGVRTLRSAGQSLDEPSVARRPLSRIFLDGVVVNVLNPKTALFFFAFLPQFVSPARGPVAPQVVFLGVLFTLLGVLSDGTWAIAAGSAGDWLRGRPRLLRRQRYVSGAVLIGLGLATAVSGNGRK